MSTFDGQKLLQVWQWDSATQSEATIDDVVRLCLRFGATGMLVKALDGDAWMYAIEHRDHPGQEGDALSSVDDARRQAEACHAAGLYYGVWVNPLGRDVEAEARLAGELARAPEIDALVLDVEPYQGHWGAWRPEGLAREYLERVRALAPDAYLVLQPDPRPERLAEIRPEEWAPSCNAVSGQHYWGAFGTGVHAELVRGGELERVVGLTNYPTLSVGGATPEQMREAGELLHTLEYRGAVLWRVGAVDARMLEAFCSFRPYVPPASASGLTREELAARALEIAAWIRKDAEELERIVREISAT
ncbi:MAG: hypothetical protein HY689_00255 [Chloroflexi bacterium]|nr:hypothetical protein [Chloroflexota bacterium]